VCKPLLDLSLDCSRFYTEVFKSYEEIYTLLLLEVEKTISGQ